MTKNVITKAYIKLVKPTEVAVLLVFTLVDVDCDVVVIVVARP